MLISIKDLEAKVELSETVMYASLGLILAILAIAIVLYVKKQG